MKRKEFTEQWNSIEKMKLFEIEVIDLRRGEQDYIIFDIALVGRSFIAQHEPLTAKQEKSKKIAFVKSAIDFDFSMDENLQSLYECCQHAITDSEFFELV